MTFANWTVFSIMTKCLREGNETKEVYNEPPQSKSTQMCQKCQFSPPKNESRGWTFGCSECSCYQRCAFEIEIVLCARTKDQRQLLNGTKTTRRWREEQRRSDLCGPGSGPRQRPVEDAACGGHDERQPKQYGALWVGRGRGRQAISKRKKESSRWWR